MSFAPQFPAFPDPLRRWVRIAPERTALVDRSGGGRWNYAELDAAADQWAAMLRAAGVGRGDRVAALAGNRPELVHAFFACGRIGAALVPLNWRLAAAELGPIIADAQPKLLLGDDRFRAAAEAAADLLRTDSAGFRWVDLDREAPSLLARGADAAPDAEIQADDPLLILYTSGSTGQPKGAILPHRQILFNAIATTTAWELTAQDVGAVSTPLFHTGGWNVFATPLWHRGGTIVMFDAFDADSFLDAFAEEGCTVALTVPTQLLMLMESPRWGRELPALRSWFSGGAPLPVSVAERVRAAGYPLREGYGLTECGPNCFAIAPHEAVRRPGAVGWPVPFLEMRLADEAERDVPHGEVGELLLRGPQMFGGYLHNPERTAEAVTADGWLRTGDLARRDPDGAFHICGRRKEMFISGGENVFPGEVEAALADCPGVTEAVVVGVADPRWGEVGRAFVTCRPGTEIGETELIRHARQRLAGYKVPQSVRVVDEIPRLGSGKPDRTALARSP